MARQWQRLRAPVGSALIIIGVCVVLAWLAATVGLTRSRAAVALPSLDSLLTADYSAEPEGPQMLLPLDAAIIESAIEDEQALLTPEGTEPAFAPIFILDQGDQAPPSAALPEDSDPNPTSLSPEEDADNNDHCTDGHGQDGNQGRCVD